MTDQTILITGASGGIGSAIATEFASAGWRTVLCGRSDEQLESTANTASAAGGTPVPRSVDVRDEDEVRAAFEETIPDTLDVLVPAAAVAPYNPGDQPLDEESSEDTKVVLDTNAYGLFVTIREGLGFMPHDGRVLVPSGSVAREPSPGMGSYAASKAAAEAFAHGFAVDVEQTIGVVDPGLVATELTGEKGRDPTDIAAMFRWAALECSSEKIDGEIVGLREWKQATR